MGRCILHHQAARLRRIARDRYIDQAARALRAITGVEPQLSQSTLLDRAQNRMMETIAELRRLPLRGMVAATVGA
jgi:hypothetical protein